MTLPAQTVLSNKVSFGHDFEDDYGLDLDPSAFETNKFARPGIDKDRQSPDSPTLGAAQTAGSSPTQLDLDVGTVSRSGRPAQEMQSLSMRSDSGMGGRSTSAGAAVAEEDGYSSPPIALGSHVVNPATIPTRTSSSNAIVNGDKYSNSPKKSPKKHRSLGSVPENRRYSSRTEPLERDWLASSRHTFAGGSTSGGNAARSRDVHSPATTAFPQQATLHHSPSEASDGAKPLAEDPLVGSLSASWTAERENILKGPFDYLESHPGKDVRSQMILAFNNWLQVPHASLAIITKVVAMLHTASLLIDDVEDSSNLRRGVPVAHSIFGTAQTINSANYVYFCALHELLKLDNPDAIRIYTDELLNLHRGQGMDLFWRDTLTCPTEDDYLEMVGNKTGGLFRLAIKLMCAESPSHNFNPRPTSSEAGTSTFRTDYVPLVNTIGLLFQILDDYRNLSDSTYTNNKGLCEDLTEGKFSFPIIHAIRSDPNNLVLINILKQKTTDDDVKRYAVAYMERGGSFSYTRRVLRGLTKKALSLIDEVDAGAGKGEGVKTILEKMRVDKHSRTSQSA